MTEPTHFSCCCIYAGASSSLPLDTAKKDLEEGFVEVSKGGAALFKVRLAYLPSQVAFGFLGQPRHVPCIEPPFLVRHDLGDVDIRAPKGWTVYLCGDHDGINHTFTGWRIA